MVSEAPSPSPTKGNKSCTTRSLSPLARAMSASAIVVVRCASSVSAFSKPWRAAAR